jgi:dTDP-4-amino-4,6-dideoxygalactose transaminase
MNNSRIYLSQTHQSEFEKTFVQKAFDTNWLATGGQNVTNFEQELEIYLAQNTKIAALNSGTSAIHLALILLGVGPGDEVICQSFTFSATANPILYLGATPIFIDSEPETWNMCPDFLENAIIDRISKGKKPKVIIAVHLYGMPFQVEKIVAIAQKYNIPLLEDSAEALGSEFKNKKCGTFGDFGIFSFNGNKIITTSSGGALVAKTDFIKNKAIFLATQSRDAAPHYQHSEIGYNYRMTNISAGIGLGQLKVLNNRIELRRQMHEFYVVLFKNIQEVNVFSEPNSNYFSNFWLTTILLKSEKTREDLRLFLEKANIESRPLWKPLHLQPIFSEYLFFGNGFSENLFKKGLCLPSGSNFTPEEKVRIYNEIQLFFH